MDLKAEASPRGGLGASEINKMASENATLIWADTFAIDGGDDDEGDDDAHLWMTTRGWPIDSKMNYVVRMCLGKKSSYIYV